MRKIFTTLLLCALTLSLIAEEPAKSTGNETQAAKVKQATEAKNYTIEVDRAFPMRGQSINLTSSYDLAVRGDSVTAYLPYFGVSQRAIYGDSEGGIKFAEPAANYKISYNEKKQQYHITFDIRSPKDSYKISLYIFTNGSASVDISPSSSDFISYRGELVFKDNEKK